MVKFFSLFWGFFAGIIHSGLYFSLNVSKFFFNEDFSAHDNYNIQQKMKIIRKVLGPGVDKGVKTGKHFIVIKVPAESQLLGLNYSCVKPE